MASQLTSMVWVFPTPVGVFLFLFLAALLLACLPHARGGVSG